ncbi:hypothetical protein F5Y06DRAFT_263051 [Hypoxylon sp. FL0890]|nr:hypothetical protein F5Y06DRAFT_263051 [Hypoxylon sp. FL0890]
MDPDSLTCSSSAVVVSLSLVLPQRNWTSHTHHTLGVQGAWAAHGMVQSTTQPTPAFSGLRKMALASMGKEICNHWQTANFRSYLTYPWDQPERNLKSLNIPEAHYAVLCTRYSMGPPERIYGEVSRLCACWDGGSPCQMRMRLKVRSGCLVG